MNTNEAFKKMSQTVKSRVIFGIQVSREEINQIEDSYGLNFSEVVERELFPFYDCVLDLYGAGLDCYLGIELSEHDAYHGSNDDTAIDVSVMGEEAKMIKEEIEGTFGAFLADVEPLIHHVTRVE